MIRKQMQEEERISTHAPAGGATSTNALSVGLKEFLLTPLREGRLGTQASFAMEIYFYSRPCGRGDAFNLQQECRVQDFYSRPCGRGDEHLRLRHRPRR